MDALDIMFYSIALLVLLFLIYALLLEMNKHWTYSKKDVGVVVYKQYYPGLYNTDIIPIYTNNGMGLFPITTDQQEIYTVFVKCPSGRFKALTKESTFIDLKIGDEVRLYHHYGKIFNKYVYSYIPENKA